MAEETQAGQFRRAAALSGAAIEISLDGRAIPAQAGESVLAAVLRAQGHVRLLEFNGEKRAGFCLMGACQDCWVWRADGGRLRACTTPASAGMRLLTGPPESFPRRG